jgi:hypothetical protein
LRRHGIILLGLPCLQHGCSEQSSCAPEFAWRLSEVVLSGLWRLALLQNSHARLCYVFHFWRCLVFSLSSLAYVYQSRMRCNTRNGNFIMAVCERGGCSLGSRLLGGGRDMQTRNGASSSQTTSKGNNGWGSGRRRIFF